MRIILTILLAALLFCGCETTPWIRGEIVHGIPKLSEKFPRGTVFYVEKTEPKLRKAFEDALLEHSFRVTGDEEKCDDKIVIRVNSWTYNDIGFSGKSGYRTDMELSVMIVERKTKRVRARSAISLRSDIRIINRYVEELRCDTK